ncbi:nuclear transport factor 2 family protein [Rhodococcus sp. NPDC003318]|uniref:nuclear transport factor 2 family protein n=1 Tax=Rhodococcus sp. NPDC003318 TaxID=3364503 RepID=UPI003695F4BF
MVPDLQYLLDYLAIRELSVEYNRTTNRADGKAYAKVWTEDGVLEIVGTGTFRGHEELARSASQVGNSAVHMSTDWQIEIDGDTARQTAVMYASRPGPDPLKGSLISTGMYTDELVRTSDGWRFKSRRFQSD